MKKSVLLPFDRYEHLLKQANSAKASAAGENATRSRHSLPAVKVQSSSENIIAQRGDKRADVDVILSCFPLNEHEQVRNFLSIFEGDASDASYNAAGEVLIGGHLVQGFHVTDALNRMILAGGVDRARDASEPEVSQAKQTGCVNKRKAVSSSFKGESPISSSETVALSDSSWTKKWRPLRN